MEFWLNYLMFYSLAMVAGLFFGIGYLWGFLAGCDLNKPKK